MNKILAFNGERANAEFLYFIGDGKRQCSARWAFAHGRQDEPPSFRESAFSDDSERDAAQRLFRQR